MNRIGRSLSLRDAKIGRRTPDCCYLPSIRLRQAPVLFSAALYLSLQYALRASPGNFHLLPPFIRRAFVPFFITVDVITTIIQIAGAALIGTSESDRTRNGGRNSKITPEQANDILLAGLALQVSSPYLKRDLIVANIDSWLFGSPALLSPVRLLPRLPLHPRARHHPNTGSTETCRVGGSNSGGGRHSSDLHFSILRCPCDLEFVGIFEDSVSFGRDGRW